MAIGIGKYELAFGALVIVMIVLLSFTWIQRIIDKSNKIEVYSITFESTNEFNLIELSKLIKQHHLTFTISKNSKTHHAHACVFSIQGTTQNHKNLVTELYASKYILEFDV